MQQLVINQWLPLSGFLSWLLCHKIRINLKGIIPHISTHLWSFCAILYYYTRSTEWEFMAVNNFQTVSCKPPRTNPHKHHKNPKQYWSCHNRLSTIPGQYSTLGEWMIQHAIFELLIYKLAPTGINLLSGLLRFLKLILQWSMIFYSIIFFL